MRAKHIIALGLMLLSSGAIASEQVTYSYDAKGRLTKVAHAGGRADGLTSTYTFDAADNRTTVQVSGAHGRVIVVPLNGITPISIG